MKIILLLQAPDRYIDKKHTVTRDITRVCVGAYLWEQTRKVYIHKFM